MNWIKQPSVDCSPYQQECAITDTNEFKLIWWLKRGELIMNLTFAHIASNHSIVFEPIDWDKVPAGAFVIDPEHIVNSLHRTPVGTICSNATLFTTKKWIDTSADIVTLFQRLYTIETFHPNQLQQYIDLSSLPCWPAYKRNDVNEIDSFYQADGYTKTFSFDETHQLIGAGTNCKAWMLIVA